MQSGPRMVMPTNPHMQHPGMNQPMDAAALQQQMAAMNGNFNGVRVAAFDQQNMTDEARVYLDQHLRMQQQQQQQQQQARDDKVAAQRALGVTAQTPTPQHIVQHPQMMMQNQGIRPVQTQNGVIFVDAAGRQVQVPAGWQQQMNDPRQPPAGVVNQAQLQAYYQQQQQIQQAQQAQQQAQQQQQVQQQQQQQHTTQQQQMLPPQQALHFQRQQQQMMQQRASQPPSARPPHAIPPQVAPGQSPALLQVPPPPAAIKRTASRAASRSASPIPPHVRPPPSISQPMQMSASAMPTTGNTPAILPLRASTLPATTTEIPQPQIIEAPLPPGSAVGPVKSADGKFVRMQAAQPTRHVKMSNVARLHEWEDTTTRLQKIIDRSQAALEVQKETADARKTEQHVDRRPEQDRVSFDQAVLEYHSKSHSGRVPVPSHGAEAKSVENQDSSLEARSTGVSPEKGSGAAARQVSGDHPTVDSMQMATPAQVNQGDNSPVDSIFGTEKAERLSPEGMAVDRSDSNVKEEHSPQDKNGSSPAQALSSNRRISPAQDLGYLYTLWTIHQDTKHRLAAGELHRPQVPPLTSTAPITGATPSSAVAARIAVANPAVAVRAASVDFAGARGAAFHQQAIHSSDGPVQLTAQLQQAEAMREAQTAQITAQREASQKQMNLQGSIPEGPVVINGATRMMTQEEIKQLFEQQQQAYAQQNHLQAQQMMSHNGPTAMSAELYGSPSADNGQSHKRGAEAMSADAHNKKAKLVGKQPTPEEHHRQAFEMARSARNAPSGVLQLPNHATGQQRQVSQDATRPAAEAQRQYSHKQATYAKQQGLAARQQIANSPANTSNMSPAQMTPAHMTAPSPLGLASPVVDNSQTFDGGTNGAPGAAMQQTPTSAKGKKGKQGPGLTVDTETAVEAPEATPTGSSGKRKPSAAKKPPKSATDKPKGKNNKAGKGGRPSTGDANASHIEESPTAGPSYQGYGIAQTPTNPSNGEISYPPGPSSAPGSSRSQFFQLPSTGETPINQHQALPIDPSLDHFMQIQETPQEHQQQQQQPPPHQQQQTQPASQQIDQQLPQQNSIFDSTFTLDDTNDLFKNLVDFDTAQFPPSALEGSFDFGGFAFPNSGGEAGEEWNALDGSMPEESTDDRDRDSDRKRDRFE
ncbi:hypothetical protein IAU59_001258 [Kwoniella sp. CBS 9459]